MPSADPNNSTGPLELHYTVFESRLGWMLLAASPHGLCLLHCCGSTRPSDVEAVSIILKEYPRASVAGCAEAPLLRDAKEALVQYLSEGSPLPSFPLDMSRGTLFQRDVWNALRSIPFGETLSYSEIAQRIGRPRATRAVGQACGRNPLAILIPCHRVLTSGGKIGGYSGGIEIKRALLAIEQKPL